MGKKLFVGGLPFKVTSEELQAFFAAIGAVESAIVITDKFSGKSKGFGFVEYTNDDDAKKAVAELDGKDFEGRSISVSEARPQQPRERSSFGGGGGYRDDRGGGNRY
jgi:RNA recognition motif-containing protein